MNRQLDAKHDEEKLFKSIIDKIEMIGPEGLFFIDKEIENMAGAPAESGPA